MRFVETSIAGAFVVEIEPIEDERGSFARTFSRDEFEAHGLSTDIAQCSISFNKRRGTLRGMHFQREPYGECKLVRCIRGSIFDVIVDLRPESATYRHWFGTELTPVNGRMLYIPSGLAHGFQTLEDATEVAYQISQVYVPSHARGVRFDDPAFAIEWPLSVTAVSERDRDFPRLPA
ncbi:MAG: dTDP-4-dehydrorhamnose 3,5-epimerase [Gaiellaceae bacterium]